MAEIIIIEDEPAALKRLTRLVLELRPDWKITGTADNVQDGVGLLRTRPFDLVISDIQLSDGTCFDIFREVEFHQPVIFTTAYEKYALEAFDFNGIQYLLKPVIREKLSAALAKYETSRSYPPTHEISELFSEGAKQSRKRLLSRVGTKTTVIGSDEVALFYFKDKCTKAVLFNGREHLLDQSLDKLMEYLPGETFFRISRKVIVNQKAVKEIRPHSSNRLLLVTEPATDFEIEVSKEKTPIFKNWISDF